MELPIDPLLPQICETLTAAGRLVLEAPPGAGKTTRVPLALLKAGAQGKIIMLEPRRLAARAAAERMAQQLGQEVGQTVGYRMRGQSRISKATRIEVVTEGILTRQLQADPELAGVGTVIFDEFHERSLNADLGLALCLEVAEALRDDLRIMVMSATLDAEPVARMLGAPRLQAPGRSYDVTPHWLAAPIGRTRFEVGAADLVRKALSEQTGSALVFLPGEAEIRRVQALLDDLPYSVVPLYSALDTAAQRRAIAPCDERRIVLATAIAETSVTLPDIRIIVDGGRARRLVFDPSSGMSRLLTRRVTHAEAVQRAGRAGRTAPGHVYKLWTRGENGSLSAYPPPDIEIADLAALALELAQWGGRAEQMRFITQPHTGRMAEAHRLLQMLGGLDDTERITAHGRALANLPVHPRLAHMLIRGGAGAAKLAALMGARDVLRTPGSCNLHQRLEALQNPARFGVSLHQSTLSKVREDMRRLAQYERNDPGNAAAQAALAYPDRIGLRRKDAGARYILSGGKGAVMADEDPLASAQLIVATDLDGNPREARIRQAIELPQMQLHALFGDQISWHNVCTWSRREGQVITRQQERFGALILQERIWKGAPADQIARAMLDGVRQMGLMPNTQADRLLARIRLVHSNGWDQATLLDRADEWLLPYLNGLRSARDWQAFDLTPALQAYMGREKMVQLDREAPATFSTPLGRSVPIDYTNGIPQITVRLQEMFGTLQHPMIAGQPLKITLLSPAQRPVQTTIDLPGFWKSSYKDVRKDMRGRYPKHPWPEDPHHAAPTARPKPR